MEGRVIVIFEQVLPIEVHWTYISDVPLRFGKSTFFWWYVAQLVILSEFSLNQMPSDNSQDEYRSEEL